MGKFFAPAVQKIKKFDATESLMSCFLIGTFFLTQQVSVRANQRRYFQCLKNKGKVEISFLLINFQKQSKFFNHFNQRSEREHPRSPLIGYAPAVVTELRNVRFQNKVWLQLKIF